MGAAIGELQSRSGHEIDDGPRDQDFSVLRERRHPAADFNHHASGHASHHVAFSGVQAETRGGVHASRVGADGAGAADGAGRAVEHHVHAAVLDAHRASAEARRMLGHEIAKAFDGRGCGRFARPAPLGFHIAAQDRHEHAIGIDRRTCRREKALDLFEQRVLIADKREVIVAGELDVARVGDEARDVAPFLRQQGAIAAAVQDQRGHADRRQDAAHVDFRVHLRQRDRGRRAGAHAQERRPPLAKRGIVGHARRPLLHADRAAPVLDNLAEEGFALLACRRPRIVDRAKPARVGAEHDQRFGLARMRRRKQAAHRSPFGDAEEHRTPRAHRIEHRAHVVHALFERREIADAIGQPGSALVEEDQPRERRQPAEEPRERRLLPEILEVRHPSHHEHEIDGTCAADLVGDVHVAAACVLDGPVGHGRRGRRRRARSRRRHGGRSVRDVADESIAAAMGGLDEPRCVRVVAERAADLQDAGLERAVSDEDVRPQRVQQLALQNEAARPRGEIPEYRQRLRRQRDRRSAAVQLSAGRIELEAIEDDGEVRRHDVPSGGAVILPEFSNAEPPATQSRMRYAAPIAPIRNNPTHPSRCSTLICLRRSAICNPLDVQQVTECDVVGRGIAAERPATERQRALEPRRHATAALSRGRVHEDASSRYGAGEAIDSLGAGGVDDGGVPRTHVAKQRPAQREPFILTCHGEQRQKRRQLLAGIDAFEMATPRTNYQQPYLIRPLDADTGRDGCGGLTDPFTSDALACRIHGARVKPALFFVGEHGGAFERQRDQERLDHALIHDEVVLGTADETVVERLALNDCASRLVEVGVWTNQHRCVAGADANGRRT